MAARPKTGGRTKGTPNRAKTPPSGTQAEGVEAPAPLYFLPSARAREGKVDKAVSGGRDLLSTFPRHRIVEVENLVPYARNARTHTAAQIDKIATSIREFGFTNPVLTDGKGGIIAGHGRVLAAAKLGMATVPTVELSHLTAEQRRAYVLADNRLALDAGWDSELLAEELSALRDAGFDLALTGFDGDELSRLFGSDEGLTDPDEAPAAPVDPISVAGDVWLLGKHRLVCGDSTTAGAVEAVLDGARPHLMVTDPPYGVSYDADWRNKALRSDGTTIGGRAIGAVLNDDRCDWREAWALFPGSVAYVWHAGLHCGEVENSLVASGMKVRAQIVWVKTRFVIGRGDYHGQHEPAFYAEREGEDDHWHFEPEHEVVAYAVQTGKPGKYHGGRKQSTVWNIEHIKSETGHSTQKPVMCMQRPIENNSLRGEGVYDPFCGSGTTLIAAELTGRVCYAVELLPAYVDVAVLRWQAFTGQSAVLEADGLSYDQVAAKRHDAQPKSIRKQS